MSYTMLIDPIQYPMVYLKTESPASTQGDKESWCPLLMLPDELKVHILNLVEQKRDLLNLSLTCRELEGLLLQRLYRNVDLKIPQSDAMSWNIGRLPAFREDALRHVQDLAIRNGIMDLEDPVYNKGLRSATTTVEDYICEIVSQVPENQLRSFQYLHEACLSARALTALSTKHAKALQQIHCYEFETLQQPAIILPNNIKSIQCHSIPSDEILTKLIKLNRERLEALHIGQERFLLEQYRKSTVGFLHLIAQPSESFYRELSPPYLPSLRHLSICGLDLEPLIPETMEVALKFFTQLESLSIESTQSTAAFLDALRETFTYRPISSNAPRRPPICMESFSFRHESLTAGLKTSLLEFLSCFSGLHHLSLLFENTTLVERPALLIGSHGSTLNSLVLETRIQARESLGLDTSRPLGNGNYTSTLWTESINDICQLCPDLQQVGLGFPWEDEMVRLRKTTLTTMKQLRIVHVRNFPQSQAFSQLGDYAILEHARRFIEWCYPSLMGGPKPPIEILAIGPTLYESRWKFGHQQLTSQSTPSTGPDTTPLNAGNASQIITHQPHLMYPSTTLFNQTQHPPNTANAAPPLRSRRAYCNPPEYLRTHYFCIDWVKSRFGHWSAVISPVSEQYVEEMHGERPLGGVFSSVWLK